MKRQQLVLIVLLLVALVWWNPFSWFTEPDGKAETTEVVAHSEH